MPMRAQIILRSLKLTNPYANWSHEFVEALELYRRKNSWSTVVAHDEINQSFLSSIFSPLFFKTKKRGEVVFVGFLIYGRFLSIRIASTATHTIMMIAITATPNSTVAVDAKPVTGVAVGTGVGAAFMTVKWSSAQDP